MSVFKWYFGLSGEKTEEHVLCPFPHIIEGQEYYENNASAQVNLEKKVFHCKACGAGHNEATFLHALTGIRRSDAYRALPAFNNHEGVYDWKRELPEVFQPSPLAQSFNISTEVQKDLMLLSHVPDTIAFPVFMWGKLLDIRTYSPNTTPKARSRFGAVNGFIIPFDSWITTAQDRWTIYCAGEKDMAVTRSHGLNAITHTGGEQMLPLTPNYFKGRLVAIFYDNDNTGKMGGAKLANFLHKHGAQVKLVTSFHTGMEEKEDMTDYFNKYNKTKADVIRCIEETPWYIPSEDVSIKQVTLHEASLPQNINRMLRASIQVVAVSDAMYSIPSEIMMTKTRTSDDPKANVMGLNESRTWVLEEDNMQDILHLMDNSFKEKQLSDNKRKLVKVPILERNLKTTEFGKHTVYKATVTDLFETSSETDHMPVEFLAYSVGDRLESGKKYTVHFSICPHPYQGQQLTMIIWKTEQASDSVTAFKLTEERKNHLRVFKELADSEGPRVMIQNCVERMKGLLGYNGNNLLIETMDLAYHTPLEFHLGRFKNLRAYLDTIIVGESRMGKSSTADTLRKTYGLGTFVSLAGNSATVPGLVGGSNKVGTSYQTKAGTIPQNHKGLMIFEEFGKCKADLISELTDIRSSNEVRITRVSGTLTLPAMVRMITLSNVKTLASKDIRSIASYPNGLAVITELVGSAEDIARYDIMLVLGDKGSTLSDPYWEPQAPYLPEEYQTRVRWVWSRTPEQINVSETVGHYIFNKANDLNAVYDSHIKVFGTEGWKKLARLAVAVASYCVSTEDYETILVKQEHVDYAYQYMIDIYDNEVFKLKQYVEHERKYSSTDDDAVHLLQTIYLSAPGVVIHLEQEHKSSRSMLAAASGLTNDQLSKVLNSLIQGMFVKITSNDIIPTERFRLTASRINHTGRVRRVGDINGGTT